MIVLEKSFFIEISPEKFEQIQFKISSKREFEKDGKKIYEQAMVLPYVLDRDEFLCRAHNELDCILSLISSAKSFFKDFHKAGGKLYEVNEKGGPWLDYGPLKPKDFLNTV